MYATKNLRFILERGRRAISCPVYLENPCFSTLTCLVLSRLPHLTVNLDAAASKKRPKCWLSRHAERRSQQKRPKVQAVRLWFGGDIRIRRSAGSSATPRNALGAVREPVPAVTPRLPVGKRRALSLTYTPPAVPMATFVTCPMVQRLAHIYSGVGCRAFGPDRKIP